MLAFKWLLLQVVAVNVFIRSIGIAERWPVPTGNGEIARTFSTFFTCLAIHHILIALKEVHFDVGTIHQCAVAESEADVELRRWTQHEDVTGDKCILSKNLVVVCSSFGGKCLVWAAVSHKCESS
jgi:hypothetical protein